MNCSTTGQEYSARASRTGTGKILNFRIFLRCVMARRCGETSAERAHPPVCASSKRRNTYREGIVVARTVVAIEFIAACGVVLGVVGGGAVGFAGSSFL